MSRPRKPYWHQRDRAYKTRIGGVEEILRHPDGRKIGHGDDAAVRAAVDRLLRQHDAQVRRVSDPTVKDLCRDYLVAVAPDCEADTMNGKQWVLEKWLVFGSPPYGERLARAIDATHLHQMGKAWRKDGYAGGTIRRLYREVMACWAWAARPEPERKPIKILESNPLDGMRIPQGSSQPSKYATIATIRALIAFAEERAGTMRARRKRFELQAVLMLRLLAETGCRPKEACLARWEEFDPQQSIILLGTHKTSKKTGKPRLIVVPPRITVELINLHGSGYAHPRSLFAHPLGRGEASLDGDPETGAPWTRPGYTAWFKKLVRAARKKGMPLPDDITLYWLRHSYLTDAQMILDGERAANLAGNTKEIARGTYLHVQTEGAKKDAEEVARRREAGG